MTTEPNRVTATDVEIVPVRCYIVKCPSTGRESPVMRLVSDWNGMAELRGVALDVGSLILEAPDIPQVEPHGFLGAFRSIFEQPVIKGHVLKASPSLAAGLLVPDPNAKYTEGTGTAKQP